MTAEAFADPELPDEDGKPKVVVSITGIALEALYRGKPLLYPKYLADDQVAFFEEYGACRRIDGEAELVGALSAIHRDRTVRPYASEAVDALFEDFVYGHRPPHDVLRGYVEFIEGVRNR